MKHFEVKAFEEKKRKWRFNSEELLHQEAFQGRPNFISLPLHCYTSHWIFTVLPRSTAEEEKNPAIWGRRLLLNLPRSGHCIVLGWQVRLGSACPGGIVTSLQLACGGGVLIYRLFSSLCLCRLGYKWSHGCYHWPFPHQNCWRNIKVVHSDWRWRTFTGKSVGAETQVWLQW